MIDPQLHSDGGTTAGAGGASAGSGGSGGEAGGAGAGDCNFVPTWSLELGDRESSTKVVSTQNDGLVLVLTNPGQVPLKGIGETTDEGYLVVQLDSQRQVEWSQVILGSVDKLHAAIAHSNGRVVVGGSGIGPIKFPNGTTSGASNGESIGFVLSFNESGEQTWVASETAGMTRLSAGGAGTYVARQAAIGTLQPGGGPLLSRLSEAGDTLWEAIIDGESTWNPSSVATTDNIVVLVARSVGSGSLENIPVEGDKTVIAAFSAEGQLVWAHQNEFAYASVISAAPDGSMRLRGHTLQLGDYEVLGHSLPSTSDFVASIGAGGDLQWLHEVPAEDAALYFALGGQAGRTLIGKGTPEAGLRLLVVDGFGSELCEKTLPGPATSVFPTDGGFILEGNNEVPADLGSGPLSGRYLQAFTWP